MKIKVTKPKPFTREWCEYFWDYYKWHTIATIILLIVIITSINDCAHRINYDLQIDYISEHQIFDDTAGALADLVSENIDDITENGKKQAYANIIDMKETPDPQYTQAMYTKYSAEMISTESFVFLVSKKYADELSEMGVFELSETWTSSASYNGYCISLKDCAELEKIGIDTSDLYIGIIKIRDNIKESKLEKAILNQENGIKFAKFLINER